MARNSHNDLSLFLGTGIVQNKSTFSVKPVIKLKIFRLIFILKSVTHLMSSQACVVAAVTESSHIQCMTMLIT